MIPVQRVYKVLEEEVNKQDEGVNDDLYRSRHHF